MIANAFPKKTSAVPTETWARPTDWLPLPSVPAQGLVGLCAVPPEGGRVAIKARSSVATASGGAFIINWGDGTSNEVAENTTFEKVLQYADYEESTLTSRGYKQAIVTVTNKPGQSLTQISLLKHTGAPNQTTAWLDVEASGTAALTSLTFGGSDIYPMLLERVRVHSFGNVTNMASMFRSCSALAEVILPSTAKATSMASMFQECSSLLSVPPMDTALVTNFSNLFYNCTKLKSVPNFNTAKATTLQGMFYGCTTLRDVQSSFSSGLCTTLAGMFQGCYNLEASPSFSDTSKVTSISNMFGGCRTLKQAPQMNLTLVTNAASAFSECYSLTSLPSYVFPKALTSAASFISGARKLQRIDNITFASSIGRIDSFAQNAYSLKNLPALNLVSSTTNSLAFNRCYNLTSLPVTGASKILDIRYCSLDASALNAIFNSLAAIAAGVVKPIIYIRGNPGTATCNAVLATSKNWTVDSTTV